MSYFNPRFEEPPSIAVELKFTRRPGKGKPKPDFAGQLMTVVLPHSTLGDFLKMVSEQARRFWISEVKPWQDNFPRRRKGRHVPVTDELMTALATKQVTGCPYQACGVSEKQLRALAKEMGIAVRRSKSRRTHHH